MIVLKNFVKTHLKIFFTKLYGIPHTRRKDRLCFHKNSTNQIFIFINSKAVYFKKHLTYQVEQPWETKFPLPLNIPYHCHNKLSLQ